MRTREDIEEEMLNLRCVRNEQRAQIDTQTTKIRELEAELDASKTLIRSLIRDVKQLEQRR